MKDTLKNLIKTLLILTSLSANAKVFTNFEQECYKNKYANCNLVKAIASVESGGKIKAINKNDPSTSRGLLQIRVDTAREKCKFKNPNTLYLPEWNIKCGIKILKQLEKRYTKIEDIIAAYNAGIVRKYSDNLYTNQKYVDKVMKQYYIYEQEDIKHVALLLGWDI